MKKIYVFIVGLFLMTSISQDACAQTPQEYESVDLGLPSGILWATTNVGGIRPDSLGNYFMWGDAEIPYLCDWDHYKWQNKIVKIEGFDEPMLTKYNFSKEFGSVVDNLFFIQKEDDPASVIMGGDWRKPSRIECQEMIDACTWTIYNGAIVQKKGYGPTPLVIFHGVSKVNGNSIDFACGGYSTMMSYSPNAPTFFSLCNYGYYWTSNLNVKDARGAIYMYFGTAPSTERGYSDPFIRGVDGSPGQLAAPSNRCLGYQIRGVKGNMLPDAIVEHKTSITNDANAPIFDATGKRVKNMNKAGLYLHKGKKYIVH
ncbi:MAG: hypothetical protein KBS94_06470 [Prevotella sp.]|nr:hypothetical protein [Candidatus Equicola faecalis]